MNRPLPIALLLCAALTGTLHGCGGGDDPPPSTAAAPTPTPTSASLGLDGSNRSVQPSTLTPTASMLSTTSPATLPVAGTYSGAGLAAAWSGATAAGQNRLLLTSTTTGGVTTWSRAVWIATPPEEAVVPLSSTPRSIDQIAIDTPTGGKADVDACTTPLSVIVSGGRLVKTCPVARLSVRTDAGTIVVEQPLAPSGSLTYQSISALTVEDLAGQRIRDVLGAPGQLALVPSAETGDPQATFGVGAQRYLVTFRRTVDGLEVLDWGSGPAVPGFVRASPTDTSIEAFFTRVGGTWNTGLATGLNLRLASGTIATVDGLRTWISATPRARVTGIREFDDFPAFVEVGGALFVARFVRAGTDLQPGVARYNNTARTQMQQALDAL